MFTTNKNKIGYTTLGVDRKILEKYKTLKNLKKNKISYVVIDNIDIEEIYNNENSCYNKVYYEELIKRILIGIKDKY